MSVLRMLAFTLLVAPVSGELTPALYAQTSTPRAGSAKAKAPAPKKKPPIPKDPASPTGNADFVVPDEDSWYQEGNVASTATPASGLYHQVGIVGIINYFGSGAGLEYIHPFTPKASLGLTILHTQAELDDDTTEGATEFLDAASTGVRLYGRYSVFSLLYAGAGFNFDTIRGQYGWKGPAIVGKHIETDFSAKIVAFDFFLGSEWKGPWSSYFGVDWIGFAVPLGGTIEYKDNPSVESTSKVFKGKTPNQRLDEETSAQLRLYYLNLRAGVVF